jgi:hypothetical protein
VKPPPGLPHERPGQISPGERQNGGGDTDDLSDYQAHPETETPQGTLISVFLQLWAMPSQAPSTVASRPDAFGAPGAGPVPAMLAGGADTGQPAKWAADGRDDDVRS